MNKKIAKELFNTQKRKAEDALNTLLSSGVTNDVISEMLVKTKPVTVELQSTEFADEVLEENGVPVENTTVPVNVVTKNLKRKYVENDVTSLVRETLYAFQCVENIADSMQKVVDTGLKRFESILNNSTPDIVKLLRTAKSEAKTRDNKLREFETEVEKLTRTHMGIRLLADVIRVEVGRLIRRVTYIETEAMSGHSASRRPPASEHSGPVVAKQKTPAEEVAVPFDSITSSSAVLRCIDSFINNPISAVRFVVSARDDTSENDVPAGVVNENNIDGVISKSDSAVREVNHYMIHPTLMKRQIDLVAQQILQARVSIGQMHDIGSVPPIRKMLNPESNIPATTLAARKAFHSSMYHTTTAPGHVSIMYRTPTAEHMRTRHELLVYSDETDVRPALVDLDVLNAMRGKTLHNEAFRANGKIQTFLPFVPPLQHPEPQVMLPDIDMADVDLFDSDAEDDRLLHKLALDPSVAVFSEPQDSNQQHTNEQMKIVAESVQKMKAVRLQQNKRAEMSRNTRLFTKPGTHENGRIQSASENPMVKSGFFSSIIGMPTDAPVTSSPLQPIDPEQLLFPKKNT